MSAFQVDAFQRSAFQGDAPLAAGGFGHTWKSYWKEERERKNERYAKLAKIRESEEYRRILRMLNMALEQKSFEPSLRIKNKIKELEAKLRRMENI